MRHCNPRLAVSLDRVWHNVVFQALNGLQEPGGAAGGVKARRQANEWVATLQVTIRPPGCAAPQALDFTSAVGLNQDIRLELIADLAGVQCVSAANVVLPPPDLAPLPGSAPQPPARFKVAHDVEQQVAARIAAGSTVARDMAAAGFDVSLSAMTRFATSMYAQLDRRPQHEPVPEGGNACDVWSFTARANGQDVILKLRVVDLGHGEAEVVDARLVRAGDAAVHWGPPLWPNRRPI